MSSRTRMMGAGNASYTKYNTNVNMNTGGGNKKQGITSRIGLDNWANVAVQTYSNGYGRNKLFVMNQLGGVGAGKSMFNGRFTQVDGVRSSENPSYYENDTDLKIRAQIIRLRNLLRLYPPYNSSDYILSMFGDRETFEQDMIDAGYPNLKDSIHGEIIQFDAAYMYPADLPNRDEIIRIVNSLSSSARNQIPSVTNGVDFGFHTPAFVPRNTATLLFNAGYGQTEWYGLPVFNSAGSDFTFTMNPDGITYTLSKYKYDASNFHVDVPSATPEGASVTSIGSSAFKNCYRLQSVMIPDSIIYIGDYAFENGSDLTDVTGMNSVNFIGVRAFAGCYLNSFIIPPLLTSISDGTFYASTLPSVSIPNSVVSIGEGAFTSCYKLNSVTGMNSVNSIGEAAFAGCTLLTSFQIPSSVTSISNQLFDSSGLTSSLIIPYGVLSIGSLAFQNCKITSVTIPDTVTSIGDSAFRLSSLTTLNIPSSIVSIVGYVFADCTNLTSVTFPTTLTTIGRGAFSNCTNLTSVTIPNGVTSIGINAFSYCTNLTSVTIPVSATTIGDYAFYKCKDPTYDLSASNRTFSTHTFQSTIDVTVTRTSGTTILDTSSDPIDPSIKSVTYIVV